MSFDFGSLDKKSNTAKTSKPSVGTHKSVPSGKPEVSTPSFDFSNLGEEKSSQMVKPQVAKPQVVKPQVQPQPKATPVASNAQPKPVVKPTVVPTASAGAKPIPKPVSKPVVQPVVKPVVQPVTKPVTTKQTTSTSAPSFDFGNVSSSSSKPTSKIPSPSKIPSKSTAKSAYMPSHGPKDRRKGKRSSSPLDALKDINPMALYGGIGGGIVVLLVVIVCLCCMGGGEKKAPKLTSNDKWQAYCKSAYEFTNKGDYQKAIAEYEKAYKLNPKDNYAPDQISIIYRNNLHDDAQAEYWKGISDRNQAGNLEDMEGASARVYAERAAKKKARQGKR